MNFINKDNELYSQRLFYSARAGGLGCLVKDQISILYFKCLLSRWRVEEKRNINYRSLAPIISLLGVSHTRECQLWAAWAVANLTLFDEDKYCPLVEEEVTSYYRVS